MYISVKEVVTNTNPSNLTDSVAGTRSVGKKDVPVGSGVGVLSDVEVAVFKPTRVGVRVKVRVGGTGVGVGRGVAVSV